MVRPHRRTVPALIAALLLSLFTIIPASADNVAQTLPFAQDWTDVNQITVGDNWSGVDGIEGFLGADPTTDVAPYDPRTRTVHTGDLDVVDDQLNTTITNGGVGEFHLADPVVGLQGSGAADTPYLLFYLDTSGRQSINVAYNLRDIDVNDNAVQPVALQYRVGSSGSFANVDAAFVADATAGPGVEQPVTPISVVLPAAVNNQPLVQVRVITGNASSSDEWVGIDDIRITGDPFVEPTPTPSPEPTATPTPTPESSPTPTPTPTPEPSPTPTPTPTPDPCTSPFTAIYSIQGSGLAAAITGPVTTQGVVVGDFEGSSGLRGFYLQDAAGDGDAATSDGIFVFTGTANTVSAGDLISLTGFAHERFDQTAIVGSDEEDGDADPLPAANIVKCGTGSVGTIDVTLPFASKDAPERFEGMAVRLPQSLVISEYFNYERFGEMVLALPLGSESRPFTPTALEEPGTSEQAARAATNLLSRITLDDGLGSQNPVNVRHPNGANFSLANRFRGGDLVTNTVGVMGFDFELYRIQPTAPAEYTAVNPRAVTPESVGGRLTVAAMNTLNFFLSPDNIQEAANALDNPADNICGPGPSLECRGWDGGQTLELDRQRDKLISALSQLDADVIGLNELENTKDVDPLGDPEDGLVAGLNDELGAGTYAAITTGTIGTDAIKVGLIYRPAAVTPVGSFKILDSSVDPRFDSSLNRPALAQTFEEKATGARFTVVVNHLKSKGSDCNHVGDPDAGDGQGNCNLTREAAAQALVDWIETDPTGSGDRDYLIIGDLNSYAKEDPIDAALHGPDDTEGTPDDFTNLVAKYIGPFAYSFVFDGQSGYLDHALSSPTLTPQVTGVTEWHINADEPDLLDYDTSFKPPAQEAIYAPDAYRASDHDPVIVGLDLLNYGFEGYRPPVIPGNVATITAGSALPMKFTLDDATGLNVLFANPRSRRVNCATGAPIGAWSSTLATVGLTESPPGTYNYDWKTDKAWSETCRVFELTLDDGSYWRATVTFLKPNTTIGILAKAKRATRAR